MKERLLSSWFAKEHWSVSEAALLLYGLDPEKWDYSIPKQECYEEQYSLIYSWDLSPEKIEKLLHDLRCDLEYEVADWRNRENDLVPMRVAQWAWDVSSRFWFDEDFLGYIKNPDNKINYADNSWIDRGYDRYAKLDCWTLDETADLLSGCQAHRDYELKSWHLNAARDELVDSLYRLSLSTRMDIKTQDDRVFFPSKEVVKWAQEKGFSVPPMLLSKMGLSKNNESDKIDSHDNAIKGKSRTRTESIHKQTCQAIAKTLWDANPTMTIEEIKNHPSIQEHGYGKHYTGKNTLRDWLREVDPRPPEAKTGRKKIPV